MTQRRGMIVHVALPEYATAKHPLFVHRCLVAAEGVLVAAGAGDGPVLVGVSGGGDSVALLEIVALLAPKLGLAVHVACIDHGLRPESAAEVELAGRAAARWGATFHSSRVDAGGEDEDSLRRARYTVLHRLAKETSSRFILLGHTSDDQIETMVFRFLRGAGLGGLAGIRAVRPPLLRPLLSTTREQLRDILRSRSVEWAEDATNTSPRYARGRLRSSVLPAIEAAFGRGGLEHLLDMAPRWRADEDFLEEQATRLLAYASRRGKEGVELDTRALADAHEALRPRVLRRWIYAITGHSSSSREVAAIERWLAGESSSGSRLDIENARLISEQGRLRLEEGDQEKHELEKGVLPPAHRRVRFPRH